MPTLRVMTFNVENMLVRFNFRKWEQERLATLLDVDSEIERANLIRSHWNVINEENRVCTALAIREADPDVLCLQEVENMRTLKSFHDRYLRRISGRNYRYKILIEGNDPRGIDLAILSRYKVQNVTTHQEERGEIYYLDGTKTTTIFRRDCLEVEVLKNQRPLPMFLCHLKSMFGGRRETRPVRAAESRTVRKIITERFGDPAQHDWLILGDLNDYTETDGVPDGGHGLGPLLDDGFSVDLIKRIEEPMDRWTHFYSADQSYHQIDYMLASPSLAAKNPDLRPTIIRKGQPFRAERYEGTRFPRIGFDRPKASDHCPVVADITF